jgi:hypothetical protein
MVQTKHVSHALSQRCAERQPQPFATCCCMCTLPFCSIVATVPPVFVPQLLKWMVALPLLAMAALVVHLTSGGSAERAPPPQQTMLLPTHSSALY